MEEESKNTPPAQTVSRGNALMTTACFYSFAAFVCALVSLNYFPMLGIDFSGEGRIFAFCSMFGHFWMLALVFWLIFALPFALAVPQKTKTLAGISVALVSLALILLTADTFVFGIYRFHIYNPFVLDLLFSADAAGTFVFSAGQFIFAGTLALGIAAGTFLLWKLARLSAKHAGIPLIVYNALSFVLLLSAHGIHAYFSAVNSRSVALVAEVYPVYFPITANRFLIKHGFVDPEKVRKKINIETNGNFYYPKNPLAGTPSGKNILVILVDSWNIRSFAPDAMPETCKFAESAQIFENHYSGDHGTRTGVLSLFSGIPGLYFNTIRGAGTPAAWVDFAVKNNYQTRLIATAGLSNPPFLQTIFSSVPAETVSDRYFDDAKTTDEWLKFTQALSDVPAENRRPFFGLVFLDQLHNMTLPKGADEPFPSTWKYPRYEKLSATTDAENFFNLYKNNAVFVDKQIKRIIDDLRERGLLENTVVILTGDHGQEFNEEKNNIYGHGSMFSTYQLQVPFVLFDAALPPKRHKHWTAHYDVPVTILQNYFNCTNPVSDYSVGKNLFDETDREWLLVGHPETFAVIEKDRTTQVKFDRSYEIFDRNSRYLEDAKIHGAVFQAALKQSREFYEKD